MPFRISPPESAAGYPKTVSHGMLILAGTAIVAATAIAEGLSAFLGSLIGVQTVFVAAGVVTTLTGLAAVFVLRGAARMVSRGPVMGEAT